MHKLKKEQGLKPKKLFTLDEVNAMIPEMENRLALLHNKKAAYLRAHDALFVHELVHEAEKTIDLPTDSDAVEEDVRALESAIEALAEEVEVLKKQGCLIRNLERGLVDFPAEKKGEIIYLSWKKGEAAVEYYRASPEADQRLPLNGFLKAS